MQKNCCSDSEAPIRKPKLACLSGQCGLSAQRRIVRPFLFILENSIITGDALAELRKLPAESVQMCVTSPPYWGLRDYKNKKQIGLEKNFEEYIQKLCAVFEGVKRVLKKDGSCWVNLGDTYSGGSNKDLPDKCLCQIPNRFAVEMCRQGWILRNEIVWKKPNSMPSSATDRFTVDFEKIFLFAKSKDYYFEQQLEEYNEPLNRWGGNFVKRLNGSDEYGMKQRIRKYRPNEEGRNMRCVWEMNTTSFDGAHFAVFPPELPERCIKSGSKEGDIVLDPFFGSGTTGLVAKKAGRKYIGIELNPKYAALAEKRLRQEVFDFNGS